jgi:LPXTG-motif cell wall-anchored protein
VAVAYGRPGRIFFPHDPKENHVRRISAILAAFAVAVLGTFVAGSPASAAGTDPIPITSDCLTGWYVNWDEGGDVPDTPSKTEPDLRPEQTEDGLLFDGPSIVHHQTSYSLATLPTDGTFVADVTAGVPPLFKVETLNPYSTLNKTADGKWWSSRIAASNPGGQSNPVNTPADFLGKATTHPDVYDAETTVFSFGVGYANDTGNSATVSSITFAGTTYDLTCKPEPVETTTTAGGSLANTGTNLTMVVAAAAVLIIGGIGALLVARRRRA